MGHPSLGLASSAMFSSNLLFFIFTKHLGRVYALREGIEHRREGVGSRAQSPPSSPPARVAVQGVSATFGALSQAPGEGGQWKWGLGTAKQTAPLVISSACGGRIVSFFKGACDFLLFCRWEGVRSFVRYEVGGRCCTARVTGGRVRGCLQRYSNYSWGVRGQLEGTGWAAPRAVAVAAGKVARGLPGRAGAVLPQVREGAR